MTDREFKNLKRPELVEIIYQLQKNLEQEQKEKEELQRQLEDKHLRIEKAGSIAEAVLEINQLVEVAQRTADQYLEEVRLSQETSRIEAKSRLEAAEKEAEKIRSEARAEADLILEEAQKKARQLLNEIMMNAEKILGEAGKAPEEGKIKAESIQLNG